jgi:uncharacterized membrane protein YkgB
MAAGDTEEDETAFVSRGAVCRAAQAGLNQIGPPLTHDAQQKEREASMGQRRRVPDMGLVLTRNHSKRRNRMNRFPRNVDVITGDSGASRLPSARSLMNSLTRTLIKLGLLKEDLDYHVIRASMVIIFLFFGYQKWWEYEAQVLIPYISNGPLIFWLYPAFGIRGASWFSGVSEWLFGALLFLGFWNKKLGILGALGSCTTFIGTVTIIPFMPNGWAASAGGFPAMAGNVPFLMKDIVLLAASVYLLKQDVLRSSVSAR